MTGSGAVEAQQAQKQIWRCCEAPVPGHFIATYMAGKTWQMCQIAS